MTKLRRLSALLLITSVSLFGNTVEEGEASWYGNPYHGRHAASSTPRKPVIYNMYEMTAAHRTIKFGTKVKVTNLKNNKSCVVTITDRGPYAKLNSGKLKEYRIIDVSYAASKELGFNGTTQVRLEIIE